MSKAILVIDMPQDCTECPCASCPGYETIIWCDVKQEFVKEDILGSEIIRPKWCPLKEMPSKMPQFFQEKKCFSDKDKGYFQGWNACLKEILGEEE